jgi:hypothetical protein
MIRALLVLTLLVALLGLACAVRPLVQYDEVAARMNGADHAAVGGPDAGVD